MKRTLLDDILDFEDHKDDFDHEEQDRIRDAFRKELRNKMDCLRKAVVKSIDDINRF